MISEKTNRFRVKTKKRVDFRPKLTHLPDFGHKVVRILLKNLKQLFLPDFQYLRSGTIQEKSTEQILNSKNAL